MQIEADVAGSPLVRFSFLSELLGGDRELLDEVVRVYRSSATELMDGIEKSVSAGQLPNARMAAHSLKGASASAGAEQMRFLAERLEHALKRDDRPGALGTLEALRESFDSTVREFSRQFAELDGR